MKTLDDDPWKIAVSGSSGLVGSEFCNSLSRDGHHVLKLVRPSSSGGGDQQEQNTSIRWVPETGLVDPQQLEGVDALVHLAGRSIGSHRWSSEEKRLIRDSRVLATHRLSVQIAALDKPPPIVISASAIGIYGDCGDTWVDESQPAADTFLADVASEWEQASEPLVQAGIRVCHPRFGIILSPDGGAMAKMQPLFQWCLGGRLGSGQQYWSWVSLEDAIRSLGWMLEQQSLSGAINVTAPEPVTNTAFTRQLAKAMGRPALLPAPAFGLRLALGEMADALLLCSCRVAPARLLQSGFQFSHSQLEDYLRSLYDLGARAS